VSPFSATFVQICGNAQFPIFACSYADFRQGQRKRMARGSPRMAVFDAPAQFILKVWAESATTGNRAVLPACLPVLLGQIGR
jgi:hypothetical protein